MTADSSSVPLEHCFGFDDQKRVPCSVAVHCRVEQREDCPVGVGVPRSSDLTLQDENLVPEGEDLGVASVAGGEHPAETGENEAHQSRKQGQERRTLPAGRRPETRGITARMTIRHPHAQGTFGTVALLSRSRRCRYEPRTSDSATWAMDDGIPRCTPPRPVRRRRGELTAPYEGNRADKIAEEICDQPSERGRVFLPPLPQAAPI
jgi:hypothetical protein